MTDPDAVNRVAQAAEHCSVAQLRAWAADMEDSRKATNQDSINATVLAYWANLNAHRDAPPERPGAKPPQNRPLAASNLDDPSFQARLQNAIKPDAKDTKDPKDAKAAS